MGLSVDTATAEVRLTELEDRPAENTKIENTKKEKKLK